MRLFFCFFFLFSVCIYGKTVDASGLLLDVCSSRPMWIIPQKSIKNKSFEFFVFSHSKKDIIKMLNFLFSQEKVLENFPGAQEYLIAYGLKTLGFTHAAWEYYLLSFTQAKDNSVKIPALNCIVHMKKNSSFLELSPSFISQLNIVLNDLPSKKKYEDILVESAFFSFFSKKSLVESDFAVEFSLVKGIMKASDFLKGLLEIKKNNLDKAEIFFDFLDRFCPAYLTRYKNDVYLLLAMGFYDNKNYDKVIYYANKVSKNSLDALNIFYLSGWSHLHKDNYSWGASQAVNLLTGPLAKVFAPDAYLILGISYFEKCHYLSLKKLIQNFHKRYAPIYRLLSKWMKRPESVNNFYDIFLSDQKSNDFNIVPREITSRWVQSKRFLSAHEQSIRLVIEWKKVNEFTRKVIQGEYDFSNLGFQAIKRKVFSRAKERNLELRKKIDQIIREENSFMWEQLNLALENIKLLELDLSDKASSLLRPKKNQKNFQHTKKEQPLDDMDLNWGASKLQSDNEEVWEDEKYSYQFQLTDECLKNEK